MVIICITLYMLVGNHGHLHFSIYWVSSMQYISKNDLYEMSLITQTTLWASWLYSGKPRYCFIEAILQWPPCRINCDHNEKWIILGKTHHLRGTYVRASSELVAGEFMVRGRGYLTLKMLVRLFLNNIFVWQVSPQPSYGDIGQIRMGHRIWS